MAGTVATYNPMTYILQGLRSLIVGGGGSPGPTPRGTGFLGEAVLAIAAFGAISLSLALLALRGRVRRP